MSGAPPPWHRATTPVPAVPGGGSPGAGRAAGGIHLAGGDGEGFVQDVEHGASPGGGGETGGCLSIPNRWLLYLSGPPPAPRPYYLSRATLSAKLPTRRSG